MFYEIAVTHSSNRLKALDSLLKIIQKQAREKGMNDEDVLNLKLAEDMFPLGKQIQVATDNVKECISRLTGIDAPIFDDTETSIDELLTRIEKTINFIQSVNPDDFVGSSDKKIEMTYFPDMHFTATGYILEFFIPNFHFHTTTAYNICRNHGFSIGKRDYAGELPLIANS